MARKHPEKATAVSKATTKPARKTTQKASKQSRSPSTKSVKPDIADLTQISPMHRQQMIQEAAYYLAERRGFISGHEMEDWLTAESTIDAELENLRG